MKKILICDDDQEILDILSFFLEENGWKVFTSTTTDQLITKLNDYHPHVVLMDNWIPSSGGVRASQEIKKHPQHGTTPIVFFSANPDVHFLATQAGADYFIAKPFDLDRLNTIIEQAYAHKADPASPEQTQQ